jgi:hypothetical protein
MIRIEKKQGMFQEVSFVLRARAIDKIKPCYNHLYVEKENDDLKLICTDTRRLHIFSLKEKENFNNFETGFYEVVKVNKQEIILNFVGTDNFDFPNYKQIMPDKKNMLMTSSFEVSKNRLTETAKIYRDFYKNFPECSLCINPEFLNDALIDDYIPSIYFVESIAKNKSVYETSFRIDYVGNMTALIMPIINF